MKKRLLNLIFVVGCGIFTYSSAVQKETAQVLPLVVIGSGPAGLTAAQYASRLGIPTTIISGPLPGGLLTQTSSIENYSGVKKIEGQGLIDVMHEQARELDVRFIEDGVESIDFRSWPFTLKLEDGERYRALSVIIATGATPRKLGVPGEEQHWGDGVSSCAICDGPFFKGKDVFVVGGGDSAVEEAIQLAPHAKTVTILVRSHRMRAASSMRQKLAGYPNIKAVEYNKRVTQVIGNESGVTNLEILDLLTDKKTIVPADGLFLAIGHDPNTDIFEGQLSLSDSGHIIIQGRTQETSVPGVFAAGDVEDMMYRQAQVAAGRGCAAALDAEKWIRSQGFSDVALKNLVNQKK